MGWRRLTRSRHALWLLIRLRWPLARFWWLLSGARATTAHPTPSPPTPALPPQVVALSQVLAAGVNVGYEEIVNTAVRGEGKKAGAGRARVREKGARPRAHSHPRPCTPHLTPQPPTPSLSPLQVLRVNGHPVTNLRDLMRLVESAEGRYVRIDLEYNQVIKRGGGGVGGECVCVLGGGGSWGGGAGGGSMPRGAPHERPLSAHTRTHTPAHPPTHSRPAPTHPPPPSW